MPAVDVRVSTIGELLLAEPQVFRGYLDPALDATKFAEADGRSGTAPATWSTGTSAGCCTTGQGRRPGEDPRLPCGARRDRADRVAAPRWYPNGGGADRGGPRGYGGGPVRRGALGGRASASTGMAHLLPGYMVPGKVIAIESFLLTAHAKLDRARLVSRAGVSFFMW